MPNPLFDLASNPLLIANPFALGIDYQFSSLTENETESHDMSYFCEYNATGTLNFSCYSTRDDEAEFMNIVDLLWGTTRVTQNYRFEDLASQIGSLGDLIIPGIVTSIYVSEKRNIFVESMTPNTSYLIIFEEGGMLVGNITFNGSIISYGRSNVIVQFVENGS